MALFHLPPCEYIRIQARKAKLKATTNLTQQILTYPHSALFLIFTHFFHDFILVHSHNGQCNKKPLLNIYNLGKIEGDFSQYSVFCSK